MSVGPRNWRRRLLLPLSLGIADGILNALTLASAAVLHGRGLDAGLATRVGMVAFVSAIFTVGQPGYDGCVVDGLAATWG
ncbi:MAG: hypothetical protein L0H96_06255 [Humibacillus sp.]|nr:hypothetical protein [Humibacillus sp.]MDN5776494.1 hypothetical protein [Humibacillus sp.]